MRSLTALSVAALLFSSGCTDFNEESQKLTVPDARADLATHTGFVSRLSDIDGDTLPDLVMFEAHVSEIRVAAGTDTGSFQSERVLALPDDVLFLRDAFAWDALRDIDGDGITDILTAESSGDTLDFTLYRGHGDGFGEATDWGTLPKGGELGDIDGDGVIDWIQRGEVLEGAYSANGDPDGWYWDAYLGGATRFADTATRWDVPAQFTLPVGDWDGDGYRDALAWDGEDDAPYLPVLREDGTTSIDLFRGTGSGFASTATKWSAPSDLSMQVGTYYRMLDVTCDGQLDLVRRLDREGSWIPGMQFHTNTGTGFSAARKLTLPMPEGEGSYRPRLVDLTGDGCRDLVYTSETGDGVFGGSDDPHWLLFEAL
ncbi:MAG: VCBS repeat-containing protein [Proteobacteria bacterium]|nr:VCBS repeat-containing protein [Pseudomonadota bacterium]